MSELPVHMVLGCGPPEPATVPYVPQGRESFWGGWGGSMVTNDADRTTTLAYMMKRMAPGVVGGENIARIASCLNGILVLSRRLVDRAAARAPRCKAA